MAIEPFLEIFNNPEAKRRAEAEVKKHIKEMKSENEAAVENIRILQGKLLLIKRELEAAAAVKGVNDLLK